MSENPDAYQTTIDELMSTSDHVMGMVVVGLIMILTILLAVAAVISFLFTMALFRVPEQHRKLTIKSIWLIMIPIYGLFHIYQVVMKLADSFVAYFRAQDPDEATIPTGYGRYLGLAMCVAAAVSHIAALLIFTKSPVIVGVALGGSALVTLAFTIFYFTKVIHIRNLIPDPESVIPEDYL